MQICIMQHAMLQEYSQVLKNDETKLGKRGNYEHY